MPGGNEQAAEKVHLLRARSSETAPWPVRDTEYNLRQGRVRSVRRLRQILTYDPVRSGFFLPAALQLELFERPAVLTDFFSSPSA
jgi:hypothetical protein